MTEGAGTTAADSPRGLERSPDGTESGPRAYLSIGEVLDALREEFPDITISKIRFLESQGLLEPERTPSGYRKFYPADLTRLRWVLQQQREKYLPLKVIRASLADAESAGLLPTSSGAGGLAGPARARPAASSGSASSGSASSGSASSGSVSGSMSGSVTRGGDESATPNGRAADRHTSGEESAEEAGDSGDSTGEGTHLDAPPRALGEGRHPSMQSRTAPAVSRGNASADHPARSLPERAAWAPPRPVAAEVAPAAVEAAPLVVEPTPSDTLGSRNPLVGVGTGVSLTLNELASASGLAIDDIRLLEQFGLIIGRHVFAATYYDEDALVAAKATAAFRAFGVEPRHLRMYKTAADREADFFSQIVTPLLRRRRDDARIEAAETLEKLARLGEQLRVVALRQVLRASLDSR